MSTSRIRLGSAIVALALVPLLAGCSVFGIATKNDVHDQQEELDRATTALRGDLEEIATDLAALQREVAVIDDQVDDFGDVSARMLAIDEALRGARQELAILDGKVGRDLRLFDERLAVASESAETAESLARDADQVGRRVADAYLEDMRTKRRDLRRQMDELDTMLANWDRLERDIPVQPPVRSSPPSRSRTNANP